MPQDESANPVPAKDSPGLSVEGARLGMLLAAIAVNALPLGVQSYIILTGSGYLIGGAMVVFVIPPASLILNVFLSLVGFAVVGMAKKSAPWAAYKRDLIVIPLLGVAASVVVALGFLATLSGHYTSQRGLH